MRTISEQELKDILDKHGKWIRSESGGQCADLSYANLSSADLSSADLRYADLSSANLSYANLSSADLSSANLRYADLSSANLSYANLSYANLSYANLRSADLSSADLSSADLSSADLSSADLSSANLRYANLSYVSGFKFTPLQVVNTRYSITIMDDHVLWGCKKMTFDEVKLFTREQCISGWNDNEFKLNKKIITEMIRYYRQEDKK